MAIKSDILSSVSREKQPDLLRLVAYATDKINEGIIITDATALGNPIIYVNEGFEYLTGYSREEILGKNCHFLQGEGTDPVAIEEIRRAIRQGVECKLDILNYRKDGSRFWNRLSIAPLRDGNGKIMNFVGVQFDITEIKDTRESLERTNAVLEKFQTDMNIELEQARRAQAAILPPILPSSEYIQIASKFVPLAQIGGDFYDIVRLNESTYGFLIADVTGHGIPAALLTFISSTVFKNSAVGVYSTCEVIEETNKRIFGKMPEGTFATMFYMIYDQLSRKLIFTQAGHPPALLIRPSTDQIIPLRTEGSLVGIFDNELIEYGQGSVILQTGDLVILYTDAILESIGRVLLGKELDRLIELVRQRLDKSLETLLEDIYNYGLSCNNSAKYEDDVTLLGFKVNK